MHQIFYIDIDEEITSIIDRLRKAKSNDVYFVVPKRALVIQSGVSLKLLKKEGMRVKKRVTIITQDQQGSVRAEKSGLRVLANMEGLENPSMDSPKVMIEEKSVSEKAVIKHVKKPHRLERIGTKDFYGIESEVSDYESRPFSARKRRAIQEEPEYVFENPKKKISNRVKKEIAPEEIIRDEDSDAHLQKKEHELEEIFNASFTQKKIESNPAKKESAGKKVIPSKIKKIAVAFFGLSFIILAGVGIFIFLPKSTITVILKTDVKNIAFSASGNIKYTEPDIADLGIPTRIIEGEDSLSREFSANGSGTSLGQKAKGTVVIYNEFSSSPQPLVGTTRLLTEDGKLFRLVKSITVPGTTAIDGKQQPGAIEAEVIADQPGEEYNIGPSSFTIPGFKGGPKFEKIYARSVKAMIGGGSKGASSSSASQTDMVNAKKSVEDELKKSLEEKLKGALQEGEKIFAEAEDFSITESAVVPGSNKDGKFSYRVTAKIKAFVFLEKDLVALIQKKLAGENTAEISPKDISFEYSQAKADFAAGNIVFDLNAKVSVKADFDAEKFKASVLGKNEAQIKELLAQYPQIENIDLEFWPGSIIERIPSIPQRVQIDVK